MCFFLENASFDENYINMASLDGKCNFFAPLETGPTMTN